MKLGQWLEVLRAANRPLELAALRDGAQRIAARAQALTGNQVRFHVDQTTTGVRITADPPSLRARRALDRAMDEHAQEISTAVGIQARERLTSG